MGRVEAAEGDGRVRVRLPAGEPGRPVALVVLEGRGAALAWEGGDALVATADPAAAVAELADRQPRWVWWSAGLTAAPLVAAGVRPRLCWDLAAAGRLAHGGRRSDPAALWAAAAGLAEPDPVPATGPDLFTTVGEGGGPIGADGHVAGEWAQGRWERDLDAAGQWARLALRLQGLQQRQLAEVADPRAGAAGVPLAVLTARAESAAALLAVELEQDGLPVDEAVAGQLLTRLVGARPDGEREQAEARAARDAQVFAHLAGPTVDLRNPLAVREMLARLGFSVPDTRSWRLEPFAATSPAIAALLAWRKAERLATTYGWSWLERLDHGRLRGRWHAADGAAGRMSAQAGLHNLPDVLRAAVRAEPGHLLVRADLGQIEPRVLAVVSGDVALARAARESDMYAPVAATLGCDRPTAKVAVLAAMYGQTSGVAGRALEDMQRSYPAALDYLRAAEAAGRESRPLRTYGGRLLPTAGHGRFARNAVIQGAAAELFKAWAATVRDGLEGTGGRIVLCLHDELLVHVPEAAAERAAAVLSDALQATARWWAAGSPVRFVAEVSIGRSWADAHG